MAFSLSSKPTGAQPTKKGTTHGTWAHNITPPTEEESQDAHPRGRPRRCLESHYQGHSPTTKEQTHGTWPHNITPLIKQKTWAQNMSKSPYTFGDGPGGASRAIVEGTAQPKITKAQHTINRNTERLIQWTFGELNSCELGVFRF